MPDVAVGVTDEAAVTLQAEARNPSQILTFPPREVRPGVPATPGAPPEVFVEARTGLRAPVLGLFYMRIESIAKTIWTDFLVQSFADFQRFVEVCPAFNIFNELLQISNQELYILAPWK